MENRCDHNGPPDSPGPHDYRAIDYRAVRRLIPLSRVLDLLDFQPQRCRGDNLRGMCVLCSRACAAKQSQSRSSFAANLRRDVWFCFACHQGGDQLKLWSLSVQQPLYAATTRLCDSTGTPIPWLTSPQPPPCLGTALSRPAVPPV